MCKYQNALDTVLSLSSFLFPFFFLAAEQRRDDGWLEPGRLSHDGAAAAYRRGSLPTATTHGSIPALTFLSLSSFLFLSLPTHVDVVRCPSYSSYLHPPRLWLRAAPESLELMRLLLRRVDRHIARLGIVLAAAEFVFTEPHSKRLMLRLRAARSSTTAAASHWSRATS